MAQRHQGGFAVDPHCGRHVVKLAVVQHAVVQGALQLAQVAAEDVVASEFLLTLQGSEADVFVDDSGVSIAGASIEITDIPASNGVIHVIGSVMLPE